MVNGGTAVRGRRGFAVGMAAGEAGRRRYSHKELTQELTQTVIKSCCVKVDIKSLNQKGDYWRGVKRAIWSPKEFFMTKSKPAFYLLV